MGSPLAVLLLPWVLSACAAGVGDGEFGLDEVITGDSGDTPPSMVPPPEEGGVILPPYDAGVPPVMVPMTPRDSGTSSPRDAGNSTPRDSGSSAPVDSGSQAPLDAGSEPPLDAGSQTPKDSGTQTQPDTGGGGGGDMCSSTPSYPTSTECGKCTCTRCATQVASCYASNEPTKNTQCIAVRNCAEKNGCMGQECYCGGSLLCLNPDGACRQEIETAAGGSDLSTVQNASMDQASPVGRSVAVGECQLQNCRRECGL